MMVEVGQAFLPASEPQSRRDVIAQMGSFRIQPVAHSGGNASLPSGGRPVLQNREGFTLPRSTTPHIAMDHQQALL